MMSDAPHEHDHPPEPPPSRRRFLKWATHGLGAIFAAVLGAPVAAYLVDPRNKKAPPGKFKTVGKLSELAFGVPTQFAVRDVRTDAWTLYPNDVIGRVWIIRNKDDKLDIFSTICTHLGCSVNFLPNEKKFLCPCHNGTFEMDGSMCNLAMGGGANPVPRGMDTLEYRLKPDPDNPKDQLIEVKYEKYKQLEAKKILVG